MTGMPVGTDTGGTFTDLVTADGVVVKVSSSREDPAEAVRRALTAAGAGEPGVLAHGTTVATNALLERRGATVALVTNEGCEDIIEIGRQDRPSLYDAFADVPGRRAEPPGEAGEAPSPGSVAPASAAPEGGAP